MNLMRDPQLGLFDACPADPNVGWLETLLRDAAQWLTARDITTAARGHIGDRDIRALASASSWIISGQRGYKHLEHATPEEISHFENWMLSQGKLMIRRGLAVRRNAHRRIG